MAVGVSARRIRAPPSSLFIHLTLQPTLQTFLLHPLASSSTLPSSPPFRLSISTLQAHPPVSEPANSSFIHSYRILDSYPVWYLFTDPNPFPRAKHAMLARAHKEQVSGLARKVALPSLCTLYYI